MQGTFPPLTPTASLLTVYHRSSPSTSYLIAKCVPPKKKKKKPTLGREEVDESEWDLEMAGTLKLSDHKVKLIMI